MDVVVITKEAYDDLVKRLDAIQTSLIKTSKDSSENIIDNNDFMRIMKISKRTAQAWRDEGKISFSQVGNKIYYSISDIEEMLKKFYNKSFKIK